MNTQKTRSANLPMTRSKMKKEKSKIELNYSDKLERWVKTQDKIESSTVIF